MKIMLIIPPSSMKQRYGEYEAVGSLYLPLGLAYIGAIGKAANHQLKVIDSEILQYSYDDIRREVIEFSPDLIGMQTFTSTIDYCYQIAEIVKTANQKIKVVLGGSHATTHPQEVIGNPDVDFVVVGEGELVFNNLLKTIDEESDCSRVNGLVWKNNGTITTNKKQDFIKNLDEVPFPARELFPMTRYHSSAQLRGRRTLHLVTARGCPFRCSFCSSFLSSGRTLRHHSAERVIQEVKVLVYEYKADGIQFYDEVFTVNRERVLAICDLLQKKNLKVPWSCFTRVDQVDRELLRRMKEAGCYQIFYGVETGIPRLLELLKKDIDIEQIKECFKLTKEAGIEIHASLMLGLPTETVEESYQTFNFIINLDPDYVQWEKYNPAPRTELYNLALKSGKFITTDRTKFDGWSSLVYVPAGREALEIIKTEKRFYRKFYLRPALICRYFSSIIRLPFRKQIKLLRAGIRKFFN
ncbi:MAG: cobalamin-dependent protein [Deltaproteobacteria bacterium]|nr:MAG: cobalamin-dependent protein [Deltaproteobacteria bacterium]